MYRGLLDKYTLCNNCNHEWDYNKGNGSNSLRSCSCLLKSHECLQLKKKIACLTFSEASRKYPYSPHRRDWNFLEGGGLCKAKKFRNVWSMKRNWNFQRGGGGVLEKIPSVGEVWIFSGVTHLTITTPNT